MTGERHKRMFQSWHQRLPTRTKLLVDAVVKFIVPELESRGFAWVDSLLDLGQGHIDRADTIPLQRKGNGYRDAIAIDFSKNQQPNFGISFRRWTDAELARGEMWLPHFLSQRPSETARAKKFGFSYFDPFVTSARSRKLVLQVVAHLAQMDECLETGKIGPNVTKTRFISLRK